MRREPIFVVPADDDDDDVGDDFDATDSGAPPQFKLNLLPLPLLVMLLFINVDAECVGGSS